MEFLAKGDGVEVDLDEADVVTRMHLPFARGRVSRQLELTLQALPDLVRKWRFLTATCTLQRYGMQLVCSIF